MKRSPGVLIQYLLPHHFLSRIMHAMTRMRHVPFRRQLINYLVRTYRVDTHEALHPDLNDLTVYPDLNSCFTRALRADARPLPEPPDQICSPADGTVSQIGRIEEERIFQAKGQCFSLFELLGGSRKWTDVFRDGQYATIYLSPRDYHRVHIPLDGKLQEMIHVPGRLFSVAQKFIQQVPRLFARNERVISVFDTEAGPMAVILVGAIFVGSIETVWAGEVSPPRGHRVNTVSYDQDDAKTPYFRRGEEIGRFNMGSTVIVLFPHKRVEWLDRWVSQDHIQMGQGLGVLKNSTGTL